MNRRDFIISNSMVVGGFSVAPFSSFAESVDYVSQRPAVRDRRFISESVGRLIATVKPSIADPEIAWMFENCFPNTLDTTVDYGMIDGRPDTFIITGDIRAMGPGDSTAQVWPYLPLMREDEKLKLMVKGLINRQVRCILLDPYANAFYKDQPKESEWTNEASVVKPGIHDRKWAIDSLCYPVRLANEYYKITGDATIFDEVWDKAMRLLVKTLRVEQRKDGKSPYSFFTTSSAVLHNPSSNGTGHPVQPVGLICSMFRPSGEATLFPFLIPSNIFAVLSLRQLAQIYRDVLRNNVMAAECVNFADEVDVAIKKYAVAEHLNFGKIYCYEADGFGNRVFMDDANIPSLMSLAYLGAHAPTDELYLNTRKFLLSDSNPYYLKGQAARGQGSPRTGRNAIWPMGIILRALTSTDDREIAQCLTMLKKTHAGTGFMHESFDKDEAGNFTRKWFPRANALFGELILRIYQERKALLAAQY